MLRIMDEEGRKAVVKHQGSTTKYILAENLPVSGAEFMPFLPQLTIHELGKQLLKASNDGNLEEIRMLMSKGAPFSADWLGTSPLHLAAHNDHLEVVQVLLQAGMSRDARTKVDRTPLHMASYEGHLRIVECLLMNGADYDCKDLLHMTPLHWAAQNGHAEVASLLIRYGASTTIINKFNLTALDIALQVNRADIVHIINLSIRDPSVATQTIALELVNENSLESTIEPIISVDENEDDATGTESPQSIPLETIILEDEESLDTTENTTQFEEQTEVVPESIETIESDGNAFSESIKLLQQHGITMLPVDDNNILSTVMESGHSVVLTEAGKQALNSIKSSEINQDISEYLKPKPVLIPQVKKKKIITVTPEEFLAMANNGSLSGMPQANILKQINGKIINQSPKTVQMKRMIMRKNKLVPISPNTNVTNVKIIKEVQDVDTLLDQLHKAYNLIETYKGKLMKCEMEVERYKYQLKMIKKQRKLSSPT